MSRVQRPPLETDNLSRCLRKIYTKAVNVTIWMYKEIVLSSLSDNSSKIQYSDWSNFHFGVFDVVVVRKKTPFETTPTIKIIQCNVRARIIPPCSLVHFGVTVAAILGCTITATIAVAVVILGGKGCAVVIAQRITYWKEFKIVLCYFLLCYCIPSTW